MVVAPVDWQAGSVYMLHSWGCYFIFKMDEDESMNSQMTRVSCDLNSHKLIPNLAVIPTDYCGVSKALGGFR